MRKTRVLVVDDSLTARKYLAEVMKADPELEVAGEAEDGKRAIELCRTLRPDVITLDMMLPMMSGVAVTEYVMAYCPTPILIVSSSTNRGELYKTYDALAAGAVDVFEKPSGDDPGGVWERGLVSRVKMDPPAPTNSGASVGERHSDSSAAAPANFPSCESCLPWCKTTGLEQQMGAPQSRANIC